eukprot:NODE_20_length_39102_cov_0.325513.p15 type:complete len:172 gc:universal NODE_20_length_39102_cov_0.325513:11923-12438(+)
MSKVRKFINKLKKSANIATQDSSATIEIEEQEQERFEEDAAATILSLLRHVKEEDVLKPYYDHSDFISASPSKQMEHPVLKKDIPIEHRNSLMDILKGSNSAAATKEQDELQEIKIQTSFKRKADVVDLLRILKHSPVPDSDDEVEMGTKPSSFKFDLKVINDILSSEELE